MKLNKLFKTTKQANIAKIIFEITFIIALIAIDLVSKRLVFSFLENQPNRTFEVWKGIWTFILSKNPGASFGIFSEKTGLLLTVTILMTLFVTGLLFYKLDTPKILRIGLILIIGGGIGNIVDRAAFGYVRDFIDYTFLKIFFNINFAIGNIADIFLCIGVLLILVYIIFEYDEKDFYSKKKLLELQNKENQLNIADNKNNQSIENNN